MEPAAVEARVEHDIRRNALIEPGGDVTCLVSGGADSTCLWLVLKALGYRVSALHVNHKLREEESEEDARFCRDRFGAQVMEADGRGLSEADLRDVRYTYAREHVRASGHTASDQVETVIARLVSSGTTKGIKPKREDGVVRPLLTLWRDETDAYCTAAGHPFRRDSSNSATQRGLIRNEILPLLRRIHPAADRNLLALADERAPLPRGLDEALRRLLASELGSSRVDLGSGVQAVREYDRVWLERAPVPVRGRARWGGWTIESDLPGLTVRGWRAGDRLAGRRKKVQDVFVDAKIPRSAREAWPLVVRGDEVVAIPGLVAADGIRALEEA